MCSSTASTTHYQGGALRRRGTMRKASSTAQPRQEHGLTVTSMRIAALGRIISNTLGSAECGPLGSLEPAAGGGGARAQRGPHEDAKRRRVSAARRAARGPSNQRPAGRPDPDHPEHPRRLRAYPPCCA